MRFQGVLIALTLLAVACGDAPQVDDAAVEVETRSTDPAEPRVGDDNDDDEAGDDLLDDTLTTSTLAAGDDPGPATTILPTTEPSVVAPTTPPTTVAPTTTAPTTTAPPTTAPPITVPPAPSCVRADIDFAAVRSGPTTNADKIRELLAGGCGVVFTGQAEVTSSTGEMWVQIDLGDANGWSAARLFDVATLDATTGLRVAFSQVANSISGGVGGPVVTDDIRSAPSRLDAQFPWSGSLDDCGAGDTVVCTWFSSDDITEVFIDVRFIRGTSGWFVDEVASGSCGGEGCGGLR